MGAVLLAIVNVYLCVDLLKVETFVNDELLNVMIPQLDDLCLHFIYKVPYEVNCTF